MNKSPKKNGSKNQKEDKRGFSNVMFIPHTQGGKLKKELQMLEYQLKLTDRIRYVEKTGASLANKLCRKDPWKAVCKREIA